MGRDGIGAELRALMPRLRRFGRALTGSSDAADDLLQDALEKALSREAQFQPGTRLDSWMYRIMQTTWIDTKRAEARRGRLMDSSGDTSSVAGEDGRRSFEARDSLERVREMMARLHDDERSVLALVSIEGQTYRQAADILQIPIGTVMSRLARARTNLTRLLEGPSADAGSKGR